MIDYHRFCQIKDLHEHQGLNAVADCRRTGSRSSHGVLLARPGALPTPQATARPANSIRSRRRLSACWRTIPIRAAQVFQRLREQGFDGGYSIVKAYVRTVRPTRQPAFLTLAFAPGECAQVDWGSFGSVPVGQTSDA